MANYHPYHLASKRLGTAGGMIPGLKKMLKEKQPKEKIFQQLMALETLVKNAIYEHFKGEALARFNKRIKALEKQNDLSEDVVFLIVEIREKHIPEDFKKFGKAFYYLKMAEEKAGLRKGGNVENAGLPS